MNPWLAFLITLSLIILVHEWGHFFVARRVGVRVERFAFGFGPRLVGITRGGTEYCICLFPFGGYVKMAGEADEEGPKKPWEYRARSIGERMGIVLAGPLVNYGLGFVLFLLVFLVGVPVLTTRIGQVLEGYPAIEAGLQPGDRILAINDKPMENWEEVTRTIHAQTESVTLSLEREGQPLTLTLQPRVEEVTNLLGVKVRMGMVGITPADEVRIQRYPLHEAVFKAGQRVWTLTSLTLQAFWRILTGGLPVKDTITGPIGIFHLTSAIAEQGWISLLQFIAVLSTSLGLFNLMPIPVLDGGHFLFLLIERLKGKPVSLRIQEAMTRVGLGLLLLLLVVVTYNDLEKFKIADRILPFFR